MPNRLGATFHRTFSLIRPGLAHVLRLASTNARCTKELLKTGSPLGPQQIEASMRYAFAGGMIDDDGIITSLGKRVSAKDPDIANVQTLWLIHYHLAAGHGFAPEYWNHVSGNYFKPGAELTTKFVGRVIMDLYRDNPALKLSEDSAGKCATALLGTYSDSDRSLGALGILQQTGTGEYVVAEPEFPAPSTFAYLLADFWEANFANTVTIHLSSLSERLCPILVTSSSVLKLELAALQALGLTRLQQRTLPYQVEKLWRDEESVMERLYE